MEEPFTHTVSLRQLKDDGMRVDLGYSDGFAANNQEVSLRGVHVFVEIHAKGENHIIRIERLPVREFQSLPKYECVCEAVWRDLPSLGKSRFRQLRRAVDVDEVCLHDANDFAGSRISGN